MSHLQSGRPPNGAAMDSRECIESSCLDSLTSKQLGDIRMPVNRSKVPRRATYEDASLLLRLYELRREERLRKAGVVH
jgi:hypothetical protein